MSVAENGRDLSSNVIKIDDARELRELGLPILPIVDAEFSRKAQTVFVKANKAKANFFGLLADYYTTPNPTERLFRRLERALEKIVDIRRQAAVFTSPQDGEAAALQILLTEKMVQFVDYWQPILASLEQGEDTTFSITPGMQDDW